MHTTCVQTPPTSAHHITSHTLWYEQKITSHRPLVNAHITIRTQRVQSTSLQVPPPYHHKYIYGMSTEAVLKSQVKPWAPISSTRGG